MNFSGCTKLDRIILIFQFSVVSQYLVCFDSVLLLRSLQRFQMFVPAVSFRNSRNLYVKIKLNANFAKYNDWFRITNEL